MVKQTKFYNIITICIQQEVVELAGYTERVATLVTVLEDCAESKYKRKVASEAVMNSKLGQSQNRRRTISKSGSADPSSRRLPSLSLEFSANGTPLIQGLVAQSIDGSIVLEDVRKLPTHIFLVRPQSKRLFFL